MKRVNFINIVIIIAILSLVACGGGFTIKSSNQTGPMRVPYTSVVKYFGYVSPDVKPDGKYKGKDVFYLYIWVPAVIDEAGVAMYSPSDLKPGESDFKHPAYDKGIASGPDKFFDTYLVLEKMKITDPTKIEAGGAVMSQLATNDDTSEIPANPSGRSYNSLLRHVSDTSNPLKALIRGVYRIGFTSFRGKVQGSYIAQVGTNIPGVKIAPSLKELHKMVNAE